MAKLIKNKCEIKDCNVTECLHLHHIVERTDPKTNNHPFNLCILCPTHHSMVHAGDIKIIGIFPSTELPNKRTVIYIIDGNVNVEGFSEETKPIINYTNKSFKIY